MNPLLDFFPVTDKIREPRKTQIEALDKIWEAMQSSGKISLAMPVGGGKSAVAICILNYCASLKQRGLYISPLNNLVDQVEEEFKVATLKGRKNYPCLARTEELPQGDSWVSPISKKPAISYPDEKYTCAYGYCQEDKCSREPEGPRNCGATSNCQGCPCWTCVYKAKFQEFRKAKVANTNFTMFLMGITNAPDVLVIDEGDLAEDFIRLFTNVVVDDHIKANRFENHVGELHLAKEILKTEHDQADSLFKKIKIARRMDRISNLIGDFETYGEPWVASWYVSRGKPKTKYEPITFERFLLPKLPPTTIIMSATPPDIEGFTRVEVGSEFPTEIRPWVYKPLGRMSLKYRDKNIPKVVDFLRGLKGKTLVHCQSYENAAKIGAKLREHGRQPFIQVREIDLDDSDDDKVSRYDVVEAFKKSRDLDKILLSVKLDHGVDLPEPDIVNNVVVFMPWPNPNEKLTEAKNKLLGRKWQDSLVANTIQQAYGRINRNNIKKTNTYILDSNFNNYELRRWFGSHRKLFYQWFLSAEQRKEAVLVQV